VAVRRCRVSKQKSIEFVARVLRCGVLAGFEVAAFWPTPSTVDFLARHPYGAWSRIRVKCLGSHAENEHGVIMCASDVAAHLRKSLMDRLPDMRVGNRWKLVKKAEKAGTPDVLH